MNLLRSSILLVLAITLPKLGICQYAHYFCLSAGTANGHSYAFLGNIVTADSILNPNENVSEQFNTELKLNFTDVYSQNPFRFEAVQVERHASESAALSRHDHLLGLLEKRGFKVVQVPFVFYADSITPGNTMASQVDKEKFALLHDRIRAARALIAERREQLEKTKPWQNRLHAAKNSWVEKDPGTCKAGGPPPLCPDNHWYKADNETAAESYEKAIRTKLPDEYEELAKLEKEYSKLAKRQNFKISKGDTTFLNRSFYYFPKAINSGLHQVITGDVFSAPRKSETDSEKLQNFILKLKLNYPSVYQADEQTIYDLSDAFSTYSKAMVYRREMMASWKYIHNYQVQIMGIKPKP